MAFLSMSNCFYFLCFSSSKLLIHLVAKDNSTIGQVDQELVPFAK